MAAGGQDLLHPPGERAGGRVPPGVGARPGHPCLRSPTPKACGAPAACRGQCHPLPQALGPHCPRQAELLEARDLCPSPCPPPCRCTANIQ